MKGHAIVGMMFLIAVTCEAAPLENAPADAVPVPADYDKDGCTDMSVKGSNGIWYIDLCGNETTYFGVRGFGGRWDFAYPGYGDSTAIPVPADYDGDGAADLAVKDASGMWGIDYARNHFGVFDEQHGGYGDALAVPVPADYDGDGFADLAVKSADGEWFIDLAKNGFGHWDEPSPFHGYGDASAMPVPADYDGDGSADLAVKSAEGDWFIDFAKNGFGHWDEPSPFHGYGDASAVPVPADYDGDGSADLAVKSAEGDWFIDFASNGFGHWDEPSPFHGYGGDWSIATPGHYDSTRTDKRLDLSVKDTNGCWYIDLASNDYTGWDLIPGAASTSSGSRLAAIDNTNRVLVDKNAPWIDSTTIKDPRKDPRIFNDVPIENGHYQLEIGVRYTVEVHIVPGVCGAPYRTGVEVNRDLHVPASLNLINPVGTTNFLPITKPHTRRFAITCSAPGSFPLGFTLRQADIPTDPGDGLAINPDYGVRVACTSEGPGLYGTVTARQFFASPDLKYQPDFLPGQPIEGAKVTVGDLTTMTGADGKWSIPSVAGGPHRITISKAGHSNAIAVNVTVPVGSGMRVDTPLEEEFESLGRAGMSYATYIDYSRGRTILHTLAIDTFFASVKLKKTTPIATPFGQDYDRLVNLAVEQRAPAIVNGCWWNYGPAKFKNTPELSDDTGDGYFFTRAHPSTSDRDAYHVSIVDNDRGIFYYAEPPPAILQPAFTHPMLAISGMAAQQNISIVSTESDFLSTTSTQWAQVPDPDPSVTETFPIWDVAPRNGKSDVDYAFQCWPALLTDGAVIARGHVSSDPGEVDYAFARTAIGLAPGSGVRPSTAVYLVVADGEGVNGANGATFNQLAEFFRDVLGATVAMNLDGGESSEMVLWGANGPRMVNRLSSENHAADTYVPSGAVFNYFMITGGSVVQP